MIPLVGGGCEFFVSGNCRPRTCIRQRKRKAIPSLSGAELNDIGRSEVPFRTPPTERPLGRKRSEMQLLWLDSRRRSLRRYPAVKAMIPSRSPP